ncbi:MAG: BlaI/MecI/CopY family transcriptional regulator [Pseudomonadales bacterium]|nr:BlaI/MecI/CopY family transcriptional regulator [Pseudomonadales bacterium]
MTSTMKLSRRERQIMDIVYRLQGASVREVMDNMEDPPSYSAVRALIKRLVDKDYLYYKERGLKYVYFPTFDHSKASQSAMNNVVKTFFDNSHYLAANFLLKTKNSKLTEEELSELERLIQQKKKSK